VQQRVKRKKSTYHPFYDMKQHSAETKVRATEETCSQSDIENQRSSPRLRYCLFYPLLLVGDLVQPVPNETTPCLEVLYRCPRTVRPTKPSSRSGRISWFWWVVGDGDGHDTALLLTMDDKYDSGLITTVLAVDPVTSRCSGAVVKRRNII
jgi:hypothetical protein